MPRKHRVVDQIVERPAAVGIDHIFGVDGANIEDLYDAAHFPDGYSRSGAGPTVVAISGGAALNLVAGPGDALARVSVLAPVGQVPTPMDGLGSFQHSSGRNGSQGHVECAADEIPPFAPLLAGQPAKTIAVEEIPTAKENRADVAASA